MPERVANGYCARQRLPLRCPAPRIGYVMLGMNLNQARSPNQNRALWEEQWGVVECEQHPTHSDSLATAGN